MDLELELPAASRAVMVRVLEPVCKAMEPVDQLAEVPPLPRVALPEPPRLLLQLTWVTPMLSLAVPDTLTVDAVLV